MESRGWELKKASHKEGRAEKERREREEERGIESKRYRYPFWESSTKNMNACFSHFPKYTTGLFKNACPLKQLHQTQDSIQKENTSVTMVLLPTINCQNLLLYFSFRLHAPTALSNLTPTLSNFSGWGQRKCNCNVLY